MASIDAEAVESLATTITGLLPAGSFAVVTVFPRRVAPVGIGGFLGLNDDPAGPVGDLLGRRVEAIVATRVSAANRDALSAAVTALINAFIASDRSRLRSLGVQTLVLDEIGEQAAAPQGNDLEQTVRFTVQFEFLKRPEEPEGIISEIPLEVTIA
jgi:hypothetical protein